MINDKEKSAFAHIFISAVVFCHLWRTLDILQVPCSLHTQQAIIITNPPVVDDKRSMIWKAFAYHVLIMDYAPVFVMGLFFRLYE